MQMHASIKFNKSLVLIFSYAFIPAAFQFQ
jgi:hypothetical protein